VFKPIKHKFILYSYTFLLVLFSFPVSGEEDEEFIEHLFSLTIEELINIKISIASTKSESITSTPATYSMDEIRQQGVHSLEQALSLIPGVVIDETFSNTAVMLRGATDLFGSKVLFLLDGIPYWGPSHNTIPTQGIPIEAIDRIEVIRGPGAVIYGTNAISGVINIITRTKSANNVGVTLGNDSHVNVGGYWAKEFDDKSWIAFSFENQNEDGYLGEYRFQDIRISMPKRKEASSFMVRYGSENLKLLAHIFESESQGRNIPSYVNSAPLYDIPLYIAYEGYLLHGDYHWKFDSSSIEVYGDYNNFPITFFRTFDQLRFDDDGEDNYRIRTGLRYLQDFSFIKNLSLLAGIEYEDRHIGGYRLYPAATPATPLLTIIEAGSTDEKSAYLQLDYSADQWRFLTGIRFTNNEKAGQKNTPRASVIYNISDNQSLKLLYAVGFTSPNFIHTSINVPGSIQGQISNKAETITTIDVAYTYTTPRLLFVFNVYTFDGDDFLTRVPNPNANGDIYSNAEKFSRKGLEIDFKRKFGNWSLLANTSYNHEGNKTIADDSAAIAVPRHTFNLGGIYKIDDNQLLGFSIQSVSKRSTTDSYLVANLNYQFKYNNFESFITLRNFTNEDPHNPAAATSLPSLSHPKGNPDLNFMLGLKYQF